MHFMAGSISDRLIQARKNAGFATASEAAKALGVREPTYLGHENGSRGFKAPSAQQYARRFGVSPEWLLFGKSPVEAPPASRQKPPPETVTRVPLLDSVTAGKLKAPTTQIPIDDVMWLSFSDLGHGDYFALKLEDDADSMDRISPPNSVIVVDKADRELRNGKYYVFSIDGETTYKMWQDGEPPYLSPYSTNPNHKPIFIKRRRGFDVIGRVKRTVLDL